MGAVGGDITQISFTHPTIPGATFFPKANEESTYDLGGVRTDDDASGVDGAGNIIRKMTHMRWFWEGTLAGDMNTRKDLESLTALAASTADATFKVAHINGAVYQGKGTVVGDVQQNGLNATIKIKFAGGQQMVKISG